MKIAATRKIKTPTVLIHKLYTQRKDYFFTPTQQKTPINTNSMTKPIRIYWFKKKIIYWVPVNYRIFVKQLKRKL